MKYFCLTFTLLFFYSFAQAQQNQKGSVKMIAKAQEEAIVLRWAPDKAAAWELTNSYGYTLERYTVLRDSILLQNPEKVILGKFKPAPLEKWEDLIDTDDYVAVAAQAIYGETFELSQNYDSSPIQVFQKTKELKQRYSFTLFSADQSFDAALMAGLAYKDKNVRKNEKYLYKVYANTPNEIYQLDTGLAYISLADFAELTPIDEFSVDFSDGIATVRWNQVMYRKEYNSFIIERAEKDENFRPISKRPIVNAYKEGQQQSRYGFFTDSIENNKTYLYRIKGRNSFGEEGPYSSIISGSANADNKLQINLTNATILDGKVRLNWNVIGPEQDRIRSFNVLRANSVDGKYLTVNENPLNQETKDFTDQNPISTAYYKIELATGNTKKESMPYLVQSEDNTPPAVPTNLNYVISSAGEIYLSWNKNSESDFLGYKVYRSNFKNSEFSEITSVPTRKNNYTDEVGMNSLSNKIYYRVRSLDNRYNLSPFSEIIEISKPDLIPPTPPLLKGYEIDGDRVRIQFAQSSSEDVVAYQVIYRPSDKTKWKSLKQVTSMQNNVNLTINDSIFGELALIAVDENNNKSKIIDSFNTKVSNDELKAIANIRYKIDEERKEIVIEWNAQSSDIRGYKVYKSNGDKMISLDYLDGHAQSFKYVLSGFSGSALSFGILPILQRKDEKINGQLYKIKIQ